MIFALIQAGLLSGSIVTSAALVLTIMILAIYGAQKKIKEIRSNAKSAEERSYEKVQDQIKSAVINERQSMSLNHAIEEERFIRLKELADEWKEIAHQRKEKNEGLMLELTIMHAQIKDLRTKYEELLMLYTDAQSQRLKKGTSPL